MLTKPISEGLVHLLKLLDPFLVKVVFRELKVSLCYINKLVLLVLLEVLEAKLIDRISQQEHFVSTFDQLLD